MRRSSGLTAIEDTSIGNGRYASTFEKFDFDNNGLIEFVELSEMLMRIDVDSTATVVQKNGVEKMVQGVFSKGDLNKDGAINYHEFSIMMESSWF